MLWVLNIWIGSYSNGLIIMMNKFNFEFLKGVNDFIYVIVCAVENNYSDDFNTMLIKMRMFGEVIAKYFGLLFNIFFCEN